MCNNYETGYIKYLTDTEFKQILEFLYLQKDPALQMTLLVMAYMGLRVSEAISLKRNYFTPEFRELTFKMLKSNKIKTRSVPEILRKQLLHYQKKWGHWQNNGYMFFANYNKNSKKQHIQEWAVQKFFTDFRIAFNKLSPYFIRKDGRPLHRISSHTLRHYVIWKYYKSSDLVTAQQIIGHSKPSTTAKYIDALNSIEGRELEVVNNAFN